MLVKGGVNLSIWEEVAGGGANDGGGRHEEEKSDEDGLKDRLEDRLEGFTLCLDEAKAQDDDKQDPEGGSIEVLIEAQWQGAKLLLPLLDCWAGSTFSKLEVT